VVIGTEEQQSLALLPEVEARALFAGRSLSLHVLRPPYLAAGVGVLRVLRIVERGSATEITAGYDRYERLEARVPRGAPR